MICRGRGEIIGQNHYDVFPEITEQWRQIHRRCFAGAVERCDAEPFLRKNGQTDWVQWEVRPWHRANGEIGGIIISELITERKQAELALQAREAKFRGLLSATPDAVILLDPVGCITFASQRIVQLFGYAPEAVLGRPFDILIGERNLPEKTRLLRDYLRSSRVGNIDIGLELHARHSSGSEFPIEIRLSNHHMPDGDGDRRSAGRHGAEAGG